MNLKNMLNFSGGPGALPEKVLKVLSDALIEVPEVGVSILGVNHRTKWFNDLVHNLELDILKMLRLDRDEYRVMFMQGGATQQFSMLPMSFLKDTDKSADYISSGYWSDKAIPEAMREGNVRVAWNGKSDQYRRVPRTDEVDLDPNAAYLHYTSNETVEGTQFSEDFGLPHVRRVCDMSSDILARDYSASNFDMIYAHAQKNLGPSGVTMVIMRRSFIAEANNDLPGFLNYKVQAAANSVYNTPPVFAIYAVRVAIDWINETMGGLQGMSAYNQKKASLLYSILDDDPGFYNGHADVADRSITNVAFRLPTEDLEQQFLTESAKAGFTGLHGHRSVGGLRASLYNGVTIEAVEMLAEFMRNFRKNV